jgi:hypothetical protein
VGSAFLFTVFGREDIGPGIVSKARPFGHLTLQISPGCRKEERKRLLLPPRLTHLQLFLPVVVNGVRQQPTMQDTAVLVIAITRGEGHALRGNLCRVHHEPRSGYVGNLVQSSCDFLLTFSFQTIRNFWYNFLSLVYKLCGLIKSLIKARILSA